MKFLKPLALATLLAATPLVHAQTGTFTDPANLRGERVRATNGRELPVDQGARGLEQMLRRLNTRASLMLIVAHPDDEDGGMLTYVSRGLGARAAILTLNRGEGGQNAMTGDFEDALGLLRTQELLSADRYLGVEQMFGTEVDFGFSKTKEEAFGKWSHERVLYDAVRAVRLYRPLVVASVFIGGVTDGHGHHQVSGEIAQEVFKAAGDPKVFPELTREGILPWQPLKVYARVPMQAITPKGLFDYATGQYTPARFVNYVTGEVTTTAPSSDVIVHEGVDDPLLTDPGASHPGDSTSTGPHSYVQFARIGLGLQKSQIGPGVRMAQPGAFDIAYHLYGSRLPTGRQPGHEQTFFDGIDTSWVGIASLAPAAPTSLRAALLAIGKEIAEATSRFQAPDPPAIAPVLARALRATDALIAAQVGSSLPAEQKASVLHELRVKRVQLNQALTDALALSLRVEAPASDSPTGTPLRGELVLTKGSAPSVLIERTYSETGVAGGTVQNGLSQGGAVNRDAGSPGKLLWQDTTTSAGAGLHTLQGPCVLANTPTATKPYFSRKDLEQPFYTLSDPALRNAPATPPALTCVADLSYQGLPLTLAAVAMHDGEPVSLVPPVTVALSADAQALPVGTPTAEVSAITHAGEGAGGTLTAQATDGWRVSPSSEPAGSRSVALTVTPPNAKLPPATQLTAEVAAGGTTYRESYRAVGYPGVPRTNFYSPARDHIVPVELTTPKALRLAYLPGTGDAVPAALASVGLRATILQVADLTPEKLAQFDTVLLGVRTYAAHSDLHGAPTEALLDFARNGGNVVLQYQSAEFTAADAPFPLTLGRDAEKVVDEAARVELLDPASPLLSSPNRITTADFGGWIEERGHGFLRTWDPQYTALTETHDPGQEPQRGGLVTARLGKGRWTYVAFALYRQLPEANPGSFRLMVDLITSAAAK